MTRPAGHKDAATEGTGLVHGDRQDAYGHPAKNFAVIAALWSAYLGVEVTPHDAVNLMILLKVGRLRTGGPHRDSLVDICGYAAVSELLDEPKGTQ